jgi:hypothetical protein
MYARTDPTGGANGNMGYTKNGDLAKGPVVKLTASRNGPVYFLATSARYWTQALRTAR